LEWGPGIQSRTPWNSCPAQFPELHTAGVAAPELENYAALRLRAGLSFMAEITQSPSSSF
jgi:hypothetical protein